MNQALINRIKTLALVPFYIAMLAGIVSLPIILAGYGDGRTQKDSAGSSAALVVGCILGYGTMGLLGSKLDHVDPRDTKRGRKAS